MIGFIVGLMFKAVIFGLAIKGSVYFKEGERFKCVLCFLAALWLTEFFGSTYWFISLL